jgi:hypothetical protein
MVLDVPLMTEEQGFLLAVSHKGLRRRYELKARKGKIKVRNADTSYLANRGNNVTQ